MKILQEESIKEFVHENLVNLKHGDGYSIGKKVEKITKGNFALYDLLYQPLLEEGIKAGEIDNLRIITNRMVKVKILRDIECDKAQSGILMSTPFISNNIEVMKVLVESDYDRTPKKLMWKDDNKLYFMEATPKAAALVCGDMDLFNLLASDEGQWAGFFLDPQMPKSHILHRHNNYESIDLHREDILDIHPYRLWSPDEAAMLSDCIEALHITCKNEIRWKGLGDYAIEENGQLVYKPVYKHELPDAYYWMSNQSIQYMEKRYKDIYKVYQIDKILKAANSKMLDTYLKNHEWLSKNTLMCYLKVLEGYAYFPQDKGELEEMVSCSDMHCVPYNEKWLNDRKQNCIQILHKYIR